jgi:hypothetical protein
VGGGPAGAIVPDRDQKRPLLVALGAACRRSQRLDHGDLHFFFTPSLPSFFAISGGKTDEKTAWFQRTFGQKLDFGPSSDRLRGTHRAIWINQTFKMINGRSRD